MVYHVKGNIIENAKQYELLEKVSGEYILLATSETPDFDLSAMELAAGDHVMALRARGSGYMDSGYSNEVVYSVA